MDKLAERPPYVAFETRPVENRTKSLAAENGLPVYDDVPFAIITPPGSKDQIERVAADWFAEKAAQVRAGRWPSEWHQAFKGAFDAWQQDLEAVGLPPRIAALQAQVTGLQGERDGLVKRLEALEAQLPKAK